MGLSLLQQASAHELSIQGFAKQLTIDAHSTDLCIRVLPTNHPPPPHPFFGILAHIDMTQPSKRIDGPDLLTRRRDVKVVDECVRVG